MVSNSKFNKEVNRLLEICGYYRDALAEANEQNERLIAEAREATVENICLKAENQRLERQIEVLKHGSFSD